MSPRMGRTGGAAARGFGKGTAVRGPRGIPSVVSATAVGPVNNITDGKINLVWTNTDATSQTRIYNGGTLLATANAAATTYSVTGLNHNTSYTLTVKHYKDSIESAGANFSSATTLSAAPAAPSGMGYTTQVTTSTNADIYLTWSNADAAATVNLYYNNTLYTTLGTNATSYTWGGNALGSSPGDFYVTATKNAIESSASGTITPTAASYGTVALTVGTTSFVTPSTWNNSNNSIECVGGGQGGKEAYGGIYGGSSGAGAGYANRTNQTLSGTYSVTVGAGGAAGSGGGDGENGGNTTFSGPATIRGKGGNSISSNLGADTANGGNPATGNNWAMGGCGGGGAAGGNGAASQGGCNNAAYYNGAAGGAGMPALYTTLGAGGSGGYGNGSAGGGGAFPGGGGGGGGGSGYADDGHGGPGCYGSEEGGGGPGGAGGNGVIYITWGA